ncbi:MAG: class III extradiol dioxygenase family protein [Actinomycetota bacterium]|nr:class III extradiol dioxygenase family protein [Actinomycetota bacterium]
MARIIGGIGASHAPSMEQVYDAGEDVRRSDEWEPLFGPFQRVARWLEERRPDRLVVIYNDHMDAFFLDKYPTFALGLADEYPVADEGFGTRPFPPLPGDSKLGWHIARSLVADEFDITMCQELEVDHGVISPLPMVDFSEGEGGWKIPVVPLAVNVILHPLPTPRRCFKLGQALRRAVLSYPEDLRVVVVGTGGLSHQLTGPRFGRVTPEWDREFMRLLADDPERLCGLTHEELIIRGGTESVEVVLWLAMRGALEREARPLVEAYYPHRIMGYGLQAYEVPRAA